MNDNTELLTKSGILKSMAVSLVSAVVAFIIYMRLEHVPLRTESVWEVFFTSAGMAFIVCMILMVIYSQFNHGEHSH